MRRVFVKPFKEGHGDEKRELKENEEYINVNCSRFPTSMDSVREQYWERDICGVYVRKFVMKVEKIKVEYSYIDVRVDIPVNISLEVEEEKVKTVIPFSPLNRFSQIESDVKTLLQDKQVMDVGIVFGFVIEKIYNELSEKRDIPYDDKAEALSYGAQGFYPESVAYTNVLIKEFHKRYRVDEESSIICQNENYGCLNGVIEQENRKLELLRCKTEHKELEDVIPYVVFDDGESNRTVAAFDDGFLKFYTVFPNLISKDFKITIFDYYYCRLGVGNNSYVCSIFKYMNYQDKRKCMMVSKLFFSAFLYDNSCMRRKFMKDVTLAVGSGVTWVPSMLEKWWYKRRIRYGFKKYICPVHSMILSINPNACAKGTRIVNILKNHFRRIYDFNEIEICVINTIVTWIIVEMNYVTVCPFPVEMVTKSIFMLCLGIYFEREFPDMYFLFRDFFLVYKDLVYYDVVRYEKFVDEFDHYQVNYFANNLFGIVFRPRQNDGVMRNIVKRNWIME